MSTPKPISQPSVGPNCTTSPAPLPPGQTVIVTPTYSAQWISVPFGTWDIGGDLSGNYDLPVLKKINKDGCTCKKCKEIYPYAEPNQDDGTLICYGCRMIW